MIKVIEVGVINMELIDQLGDALGDFGERCKWFWSSLKEDLTKMFITGYSKDEEMPLPVPDAPYEPMWFPFIKKHM